MAKCKAVMRLAVKGLKLFLNMMRVRLFHAVVPIGKISFAKCDTRSPIFAGTSGAQDS